MEREESPTERAVFNLATAWQESEAKLTAATARAEKAEAMYAKATFALDGWKQADTCDPMAKGECIREARERTDAHDAERREAGL